MDTQQEILHEDLTPKSPSPLMLKVLLGAAVLCLLLSLIEVIQELSHPPFDWHALTPLLSSFGLIGMLWIQWRTSYPAPGSYFVRIYPTQLEYQGAHHSGLVQINLGEISKCYLEWNRIDIKVDEKPWMHIQARGPRQAKMIYEKLRNYLPPATQD